MGRIILISGWQDHFLSKNARICRVDKLLPGKTAADGNNAALLYPGSYLTQRLLDSANAPVLARKGMKLRIRGKAMLMDRSGDPRRITVSMRVVVGIRPEMLQYQPFREDVLVDKHEWVPFEVIAELPKDSLVFGVGYMDKIEKARKMDLEGKPLTVSVDNRSKGAVMVDALEIELVEDDEGEAGEAGVGAGGETGGRADGSGEEK